MKFISKTVVFGLILVSAVSCQDDTLPNTVSQTKFEKYVEFRGEQVRIPLDFPINLLEQTPEELRECWNKTLNPPGARKNEDQLTFEQVGIIIAKHSQRYPTINSNMELPDSTYTRILKDFPRLQTKEEALRKIAIIYDYYNIMLRNDILPEIIENRERGSETERVNSGTPGTLTDAEFLVILGNPGYGQHYIAAAQEVNNLELAIFNETDGRKKNNAWKHGAWNALSIRYILKGSPASENQAIAFTQNGTSVHEKEESGNTQKHDIETAMDLHNNMSARVWMEKETKWGIGPFRKMPSVNDIINEMFNKATNANFYDSASNANAAYNAILNAHGGDNAGTWNNLYNNLYGPYEHLVYILN